MVTDVAIITEQKTGFVVWLTTSFTHRALQASPAFVQNYLGELNVDTKWVITLPALRTRDQHSVVLLSQTTAHDANVLLE